MSQRKRTSKRRWKARCRIGQMIPKLAIVNHRLDRWFTFETTIYSNHDYFRAFWAEEKPHG